MRLWFNDGPSFNDRSGLRKALLALAAFVLCAAIAPAASARAGAGVIVASSSPANVVGRVVEIGQTLRLEPGATVTILEESGRVATIVRTGAYRPTPAPSAHGGPSMIDSISALMSSDRSVRTPGGVRTLEDDGADCAAPRADAGVEGLERALAAQCAAAAMTIVDRLVEAAGPPQLYLGLVHSRAARERVIGIEVQANFEAYLYCRLRRADAAMLAITPEPGALPVRVVASSSYDFTFPTLTGETAGAVQCLAIGARPSGAPPEIGDWPRELDPERARDARVASALLPIEP